MKEHFFFYLPQVWMMLYQVFPTQMQTNDHHHHSLETTFPLPRSELQQLVKQLAFIFACCIVVFISVSFSLSCAPALSSSISSLRYRFLTADEIKKTAHCVWCCPWRRVLPASSRYGVQRGVPLGGIKSLPSFSSPSSSLCFLPSSPLPLSLPCSPACPTVKKHKQLAALNDEDVTRLKKCYSLATDAAALSGKNNRGSQRLREALCSSER